MIWLGVGALLISVLAPAEVQWLQYRTAENARDIIGGSSQYMEVDAEAPADLALPELTCDKPMHFRWNNAMDAAGFRRIVLDKKHQYGMYDVLYIDADGDGKLAGETKYEGQRRNEYETVFNGVPVVFKGEDGPVTYHLNLSFRNYDEHNQYIYAYAGCWYEGQVKIGGKETRCVLADYNCNGSFNDKSESFSNDRVLIGPEQNYRQHYVGNFVELDGALYRFSAAKDGAFVEFAAAPEVKYAEVTMPETITSIMAGGLNGMFERTVENGKATLPEGTYRLYSWEVKRKDEKGKEWRLNAYAANRRLDFEVTEGGSAKLDIGEPIFSQLDVQMRNGMYAFNQGLEGRGGERISLYLAPGGQPPAPKIHVRNKTGEYDRTFSLEYG